MTVLGFLLLAEEAARPAAPEGVPTWVAWLLGSSTTVLAVLKLLGGGKVKEVQDGAKTVKKALALGERILDAFDGEETPEEKRAGFEAFLEEHGGDPVWQETLKTYQAKMAAVTSPTPNPPAKA